MDELFEKWNNNQDNYEALEYNKKSEEILIVDLNNPDDLTKERWVCFYSWLFTPKYKVFEVFTILPIKIIDCKGSKLYRLAQPEEIIKYLEQTIKESK